MMRPTDINHWGDNFIPVVPVDHAIHTPENPFCDDPTCYCHEHDAESIEQVNGFYQEGIVTSDEATDIVNGKRSF